MKYFMTMALLTFTTFTYANDSLPVEIQPAYEAAHKVIKEKLGTDNFQIFYEYRIAYEDDQLIRFSFKGDFQNCEVEVRSESTLVESFTCSTSLKPKGHLICDKDNHFIILIENGIFQLVGKSKFQLSKDWSDLHYATYGTDYFMSVTFTDKNMQSAIIEQGLLWVYGDVDESSVIKTELSKSYCK
ncbi:MAG: hypothetical protein WA160_13615 [Pseudobdellovibrio sp.]